LKQTCYMQTWWGTNRRLVFSHDTGITWSADNDTHEKCVRQRAKLEPTTLPSCISIQRWRVHADSKECKLLDQLSIHHFLLFMSFVCNVAANCKHTMSVMIIGGEVLFWWDYLRTLYYLLYIFVLRSFHCIFKIVCPCTTLYLFLAFQLQLNKLEVWVWDGKFCGIADQFNSMWHMWHYTENKCY